tara:strand:+ start:295 stop:444 length:150 start_codon:yes stop_codon:yes gene_type:complete
MVLVVATHSGNETTCAVFSGFVESAEKTNKRVHKHDEEQADPPAVAKDA